MFEFCGTICMAARKLRITMNEDGDRFVFFDTINGAFIYGPRNSDKQQAMKGACETLVEYLNK